MSKLINYWYPPFEFRALFILFNLDKQTFSVSIALVLTSNKNIISSQLIPKDPNQKICLSHYLIIKSGLFRKIASDDVRQFDVVSKAIATQTFLFDFKTINNVVEFYRQT